MRKRQACMKRPMSRARVLVEAGHGHGQGVDDEEAAAGAGAGRLASRAARAMVVQSEAAEQEGELTGSALVMAAPGGDALLVAGFAFSRDVDDTVGLSHAQGVVDGEERLADAALAEDDAQPGFRDFAGDDPGAAAAGCASSLAWSRR